MKLHQRIRRDQARHTDDWLITYADTITLLLCLFVVILSVKTGGQGLARDQAASVKSMTAPDDIFARDPTFQAPVCIADPGAAETPVAPINIVPEPISGLWRVAGFDAGLGEPPVLDDPFVPQFADAPPTSLPAIADHLKSQGAAVVARQGDRITTLQIASAAFFGSGDAALSGTGKSILLDVASRLKSNEFAAYHITIEGHTDDTPIRTVLFQSNWELSSARAAAVVRFFLEQGIAAERLTAAGYADTFPLAANRNGDGTIIPENQAKNRRVLIRLEKIDKAERSAMPGR
jgi:chemotaxis protein MotB